MVRRNYTGALALSALLGCSASSDNDPYQKPDYVQSASSNPLLEQTMDRALLAITGRPEPMTNPFWGKRVTLLYETGPNGGGPVSGSERYTGGRPVDPGLLDLVRARLKDSRAYVLEEAVFAGNYEDKIAQSRMPNMSPADVVVIADENPRLGSDLKNVYIVEIDGAKYKIVEAKK